ncbi:MAG: hypothetical protein ABT20_01170 [Rubrivivax sp. SCN 70-15]|nr:MAG: hypothetical protein ABT20_01170 [Rubrivivax sp. SCN 70-15]
MSVTDAPDRDAWLSRGLVDLWPQAGRVFDVVVVGSGYGGSVAAAALAGCSVSDGHGGTRTLSVCVLERGREFRAGAFPARLADLPGELRIARQNSGRLGKQREGLFDLRWGDDVVALLANGLGGGSLINAGVLLEPRPMEFEPGPWRDLLTALDRDGWHGRARRVLGGVVADGHGERANTIERHAEFGARSLGKFDALRGLRRGADTFEPAQITVAMADETNAAGVRLSACTLCGDCMSGCNVGAKNSLDVNLLTLARRAGVEIYTGASVRDFERDADHGQWWLNVVHTDARLQAREGGPLRVAARRLVLAAGSLGSTELLLRSQRGRLRFSPRLGERFSCNGDNIAALRFPAGPPVQGCADEDSPLVGRGVGPTITGILRVPADAKGPGFLVQDFSVPAPLKRVYDEAVTSAAAIAALPGGDRTTHGGEDPAALDPMAVDAAAMARTLLVGTIGHDDGAGILRLAPRDRGAAAGPSTVQIVWPQARHSRALDHAHDALRKHTPEGAAMLANPVWRLLPKALEDLVSQPRGPVLTTHPLGGCAIGASVADGVVDDCGRVFDAGAAPRDSGWEGSLVVLDGAIVPGALAANPALTITALALRAMAALREAWALSGGGALGERAADPAAPGTPRLRAPAPALHAVPGTPPDTEIQVMERLRGPVRLNMGSTLARPYVVELSLVYAPVAVRELVSTLERRLCVVPEAAPTPSLHRPRSTLRLFDAATWDGLGLRSLDEAQRIPHALFEAELRGSLRFLHREASGPWQRRLRALLAWARNRGLRDSWQAVADRNGKGDGRKGDGDDSSRPCLLLALADRAGEVRRFDYELEIGAVLHDRLVDDAGRPARAIPTGAVIRGHKRLTYGCRASPWRQLTELSLTMMPAMQEAQPPLLRLDTRFFSEYAVPLLRITRQRDQVSALADLASLALAFARALGPIHLWTLRKPDTPSARPPQRLPGRLARADVLPEVTLLNVGRNRRGGAPVQVRLTRYARASSERPPLVMIHGYSASGTTFTHASLAPSAAEYFWQRGRDVWVLDLRTSAGLPTASLPWAMEDAGLIDIPAALLHIRQVTGRRVDVLAHCIGGVMLSMALLAEASEVRSGRVELGVDSWLDTEQLATLAAFNRRTARVDGHPCIERIVLSQKGPVLRYTDDNLLRAYLMQYLRRWLLPDGYAFRPRQPQGVADDLVDRLLASLPYSDADYDVENPRRPWARTPWVASRHRMDALYGRTFEATELGAQTLAAIDDLFGPLNLETVAQTIQFARWDAVTNQRGRGEFVTRQRLRRGWSDIPTLALHGADNGLVDVYTQQLLETQLGGAGVPVRAITYKGLGHQDLLIGRAAAFVFDDIEAFLSEAPRPARAEARACPAESVVFALPWLGPRLDVAEGTPPRVRVGCLSRPDQGLSRLVMVPVRHCAGRFAVAAGAPMFFGPIDQQSGRWQFAEPDPVAFPPVPGVGKFGWLALLVYARDETTAEGGATGPGGPATRSLGVPRLLDQEFMLDEFHLDTGSLQIPTAEMPPLDGGSALRVSVREWLPTQRPELLAQACVDRADLERAVRLAQPVPVGTRLRFVLASCQYPAGPVDALAAQASLLRMERLCAESPEIGLLLFAGDQIYADASAGLVDPSRSDERYDRPHDVAMQRPPLRRLLARMNAFMLVDDHEIVDNWEPLAPGCRGAAARAAMLVRGLAAYWNYERMAPQRRQPGRPPCADRAFVHASHAFYAADTRTGRSPRGAMQAPQDVQILEPEQWHALQSWLLGHHDDLKFVMTPSTLLPQRVDRAGAAESRAHSDAWDGYEASLDRLLDFIAGNRILRTVFLSGDEHRSFVTEAWLTAHEGAPPVKIVSVHSSALYAPFPFTNSQPRDFADRPFTTASGVAVRTRTHWAAPGDGFAVLEPDAAGRSLTVEFLKGEPGIAPERLQLALLT